jgi:hypothetical protein
MHRSSRLLLFALPGVIVSGCSRDGPLVGPEFEQSPAAVLPGVVAAAAKAPPVADAGAADGVDDALTRLVPSLGAWGTPLRDALLRFQAHKKDETEWTNVQRVIEAVSTNLPDELRPDLDALQLELGIAVSQ